MKKQTVESVVYVIDDDASVRDSLKSLFGSVGLHVELFEVCRRLSAKSASGRRLLLGTRCPVARPQWT